MQQIEYIYICSKLIKLNLYRREVMLEVIEGSPSGDLGAGSGPNNTREGRPPVLFGLDMPLQPGRVICDPELPVRPARHWPAAASACGDSQPEHRHPEQGDDEEQHGEEVQPQGAGDVVASADEAGEGDQEDDEADGEERCLQRRFAGRAMRQPQPCTNDGDRRHKGQQVEVPDHCVA
jgi:hypothetical protein